MKSLKSFLQLGAVMILFLIISLAVFLLLFVSISWIQGNLLVPEDFTIWAIRDPYNKIMFVFQVIITLGLVFCFNRIKDRKNEQKSSLSLKMMNFFKVNKLAVVIIGSIIMVVMLYLYIINIICIKDENIILRSTISPLGKEYSLSDVKEVETGFSSMRKYFGASKGTFYYKITLKDGKKFDINNFSSEGKKYEEDTYSAIEEIDKKIMESNPDVMKTSSLDYYEYAGLAEKYMDRFQRIIENKM